MFRLLAFVALAGVAGVVSTVAAYQPTAQPVTPPPAAAEPPAPKSIPVPDGPVIQTQELDGGLIVEDIKLGDGNEVKPGSAVVAHYHGTVKADGSVFQSSFETGQPIAFHLDGVIAGWSKGLPGMKVGGVRRLTIPSAMAYGERSPSEKIPANADLVFVIQLEDALYCEDIKEGSGETASSTCVAVTLHTVKTADGAEVEKSDMAAPYVWLPGEMNSPGTQFDTMQLAFAGMKVGGKRKIHVPAEMNGAPPQLEIKRPRGVDLDIEVELVAVRNLPQRGRPGGR